MGCFLGFFSFLFFFSVFSHDHGVVKWHLFHCPPRLCYFVFLTVAGPLLMVFDEVD